MISDRMETLAFPQFGQMVVLVDVKDDSEIRHPHVRIDASTIGVVWDDPGNRKRFSKCEMLILSI